MACHSCQRRGNIHQYFAHTFFTTEGRAGLRLFKVIKHSCDMHIFLSCTPHSNESYICSSAFGLKFDSKTLRANVMHNLYNGIRLKVHVRVTPCNLNGEIFLHVSNVPGYWESGFYLEDKPRLNAG